MLAQMRWRPVATFWVSVQLVEHQVLLVRGIRRIHGSSSSDGTMFVCNRPAITTGRGEARTEVGMAALDIRCPYLILCQISDSQTYASALSKLYLFDPTEVSPGYLSSAYL